MTEIYIDDNRIDFEDTENDATIGELIGMVEAQLKEQRRFVEELIIDGRAEPDFRSEATSKRLILNFATLKLLSSTVESIALEGVDVLERYLTVVLENINKYVSALRTGGSPAGASPVVVIDGMTEIAKTMNELNKGGVNYDITIFRADPALFYSRILGCLETLNKAKESVDSVLMGDILEYELKPLVEEMLNTLFAKRKN